MPYIQTSTMFWMQGGGFPAEPCDEDDPNGVYCGPGSEYSCLRPVDVAAFNAWRDAGMPHDEKSLRDAGWVPASEAV